MTNYLGKSCSFCLPRVPFVSYRRFVSLVISLFGFEGRIWDLIVLVPDHCLSFYFSLMHRGTSSCSFCLQRTGLAQPGVFSSRTLACP